MSVSILSPEPEHRKNRLDHHRGMKTWEIIWVLCDAQAAPVWLQDSRRASEPDEPDTEEEELRGLSAEKMSQR